MEDKAEHSEDFTLPEGAEIVMDIDDAYYLKSGETYFNPKFGLLFCKRIDLFRSGQAHYYFVDTDENGYFHNEMMFDERITRDLLPLSLIRLPRDFLKKEFRR